MTANIIHIIIVAAASKCKNCHNGEEQGNGCHDIVDIYITVATLQQTATAWKTLAVCL